MLSFVRELWLFIRVRRKFWLLPVLVASQASKRQAAPVFWGLPVLVMMAVFGGLIVLTQGSAVAPFIYTIF